MSTTNEHPAGIPRRVDTMQPDPQAAADHYAALFGWALDAPVPMPGGLPGEHRTARAGGRPVAGVGQAPPGAPAVWTTWLAVDDVGAAVDRGAAAGGGVLLAPTAGTAGQIAVVTDPAGVAFGLVDADCPPATERADAPGAWTMSSLHTPDPDGARRYYGAVLGWRADPVPGAPIAFWRAATHADPVAGPGPGGGVLSGPGPDPVAQPEPGGDDADDVLGVLVPIGPGDPTPPHWSVCFRVADVDAVAARSAELGGTILMGPVDTPGFRSAVLADPQGGVVAVTCPA